MNLRFIKNFLILFPLLVTSQTSTAVDFDDNFPKITGLRHFSIDSWAGERPQGLFNCLGYESTSSDKSVLNGIEFSWRSNTPESTFKACSNFFKITSTIITGKSENGITLKAAEHLNRVGNFAYNFFLDNEDYPIEVLSFLTSSKSRFGWYRLNSKQGYENTKTGFFQSQKPGFSNGVFSSPLTNLPTEGKSVFNGKASNPRLPTAVVLNSPSTNPMIDIASVDFAKAEVTIKASMPHWDGTSIQIVSKSPMVFDKKDGSFNGVVNIYGGPDIGQAYVNGFIGGNNAEGMVLMLANGDAFGGNGTDFMIGAKK